MLRLFYGSAIYLPSIVYGKDRDPTHECNAGYMRWQVYSQAEVASVLTSMEPTRELSSECLAKGCQVPCRKRAHNVILPAILAVSLKLAKNHLQCWQQPTSGTGGAHGSYLQRIFASQQCFRRSGCRQLSQVHSSVKHSRSAQA